VVACDEDEGEDGGGDVLAWKDEEEAWWGRRWSAARL